MQKIIAALLLLCSLELKAQMPADSSAQFNKPHDLISAPADSTVPLKKNVQCVYHVKPLIDLSVCAVEGAGALYGLSLLNKKKPSDVNDILNLDPNNLLPVNRAAIHEFNPAMGSVGDVFLYGSIVCGFTMFLDRAIRH